jgi:hypothetical protein
MVWILNPNTPKDPSLWWYWEGVEPLGERSLRGIPLKEIPELQIMELPFSLFASQPP